MNAGEFKIATIFDWGGDFYRPAVDKTEISSSGIADGTVVCWKEDAERDMLITNGKLQKQVNTA